MTKRLEQLHEFLKEDPNDPFNIYALALEYSNIDRQKARELFDELLLKHEDYIPAYYHAGNLYLSLTLTEQAIKIFEKGIVQARSTQSFKAMRELQTVYDELTM
jgi:tetratricopeptide (TPR) repeat protein